MLLIHSEYRSIDIAFIQLKQRSEIIVFIQSEHRSLHPVHMLLIQSKQTSLTIVFIQSEAEI